MSQLIPFESANVPAAVAQMFSNAAADLVGNNPGGGFPVISIKGKVFHIQRGGERTLITKPGEEDPAASIEVVVIKANPNRSKVFYANGYVEGDASKPNCYSNNGIEPEADAAEPQAKKCAACPHNQWGSRVTTEGRKAKACADSRRLAIATPGAPNDPMLLRVPAASMKSLEDYGKLLAARGVPHQAVVTKIGFDYSVAHPALTFKPVGMIGDRELLAEVAAAANSDLAAQIAGTMAMPPAADGDGEEDNAPAPAPKAAAPAQKPAAAPKAAPKPAPKPSVDETLDAAEAVAARTPKASVSVAPASSLEDEVRNLVGGMDFDD